MVTESVALAPLPAIAKPFDRRVAAIQRLVGASRRFPPGIAARVHDEPFQNMR
jgi:hypothetical protein